MCKNIKLLNVSILQNVTTHRGISEISFYPENKQRREWSKKNTVFISTLLISVRGRWAAKTNPGPSPSQIRTLNSLFVKLWMFWERVSQQRFHTKFCVWPQTREHPTIFNGVTQSGAGRNPWGAAALLRTPKLFVRNSAHTWPKKKKKKLSDWFCCFSCAEGGSKQSFSISINFLLWRYFQVNIYQCWCPPSPN